MQRYRVETRGNNPSTRAYGHREKSWRHFWADRYKMLARVSPRALIAAGDRIEVDRAGEDQKAPTRGLSQNEQAPGPATAGEAAREYHQYLMMKCSTT
jgi:hypothetical protein